MASSSNDHRAKQLTTAPRFRPAVLVQVVGKHELAGSSQTRYQLIKLGLLALLVTLEPLRTPFRVACAL